MPLRAQDLLDPDGELVAADLWPDDDESTVEDRLDAYLADGYVKAGAVGDEAARQWAYHRAYKGVYTRLLAQPSSVSLSDEGSASYTQTQIAAVGALADQALATFEGLMASAVVVETVPARRGSASVPVRFAF